MLLDIDIVLAALLPTGLVLVAGLWLIFQLRVHEEGSRYQHREYRADEKTPGSREGNGGSPDGGDGARGNGHTPH